jgi:hypothetical protein
MFYIPTFRINCCVKECTNGIRIPWTRGLWAICRTGSLKPYVCLDHRDLFDDE